MLLLLVGTLLLSRVAAQLDQGSPGTSPGSGQLDGAYLCNRTFAEANSTGVVTFDPDVGASSGNISWASTVSQPPDNDFTELSLWFSTNGANYSDNYNLGYDVCYLWPTQFDLNTFERGQDDNGTCLQTLDQTCVNDFLSLTDNYSRDLVGVPSPGPHSNLSSNSLPSVCRDLADMLTQNFPNSCKKFFNVSLPTTVSGGPPALGGALTGPQSLVGRSYCQTNGSYSLMWTQYGSKSLEDYAIASYFVTPLITAFMPIADAARPITLGYTKSRMTCLRSKNLNRGSRELPPAPSPTPVDSSDDSSKPSNGSAGSTPSSSLRNTGSSRDLSGGAIAGIVVGVVLGLALVAGVAALVIIRKRRKYKSTELGGAQIYDEAEKRTSSPNAAEMPNSALSEMAAGAQRAELGAMNKEALAELPGHRGQAINQTPAELG